jgi:Carboxypeptidase regulatory-like domain/TonB-dependent Receptor Plug Domain
MRFPRITALIVPLVLMTLPAFGQSPNGNINGLVLDPTSQLIVGAEVIAVNDVTGVQYKTKTNDAGVYVLPNLPAGPYRLQVSKVGFKTIVRPDIILNVQDALSINFTLPIGAILETVTVTGGGPLVQTQSGSVSTVITRQFIENVPLNGRTFNTLLQLTPGVTIAPSSFGSPGQFSVAGQRTDANNFTVDGVSANFGITAGQGISASGTGGVQAFSALGGTNSLVSVEGLQEFRIETSSFAPEFGKTPGGQVVLTTRSGTDEFHGGLYEYFRNTVMDANDWFANEAGNARAEEQHSNFGGYLGGPLRRQRSFFFASYEGARLRLPQTASIQVPSEAARAAAPANLAPFLNAYPRPNGPPTGAGDTAQLTGTYSNSATLDAGSIRIDHRFSERFSIFGRYNDAPSQTVNRVFSLSDLQRTEVNTRTFTVGLNMLLSSRWSNTLRANYSSQTATLTDSLDNFGGAVPIDPGLILNSLSGSNNYAAFLAFNATDYFIGPSARNRARQLNVADDLSLVLGKHQLKIGGDYRAIFATNDIADHNVYLTTETIQDFLTSGAAGLSSATFAPARLLAQSVSGYGQDDWRVHSRLSLVFGFRWELSPAPSALGSTRLASWLDVNDPASLRLAPAGTPPWQTTFRNFAPRFGVAYQLTSKGDIVVRAGAGFFYDLGVGTASVLSRSFPNSAFQFTAAVPVPVTSVTAYLPPLSTDPPYPSGVYGFDPHMQLPRSYQWNVALEKSFRGDQVISATYAGQSGRRLLRQQALFQPNTDFAGDFLLTINSARSNYSSLQLQYRKPIGTHIQAMLGYTYSHSLDNASSDVVSALGGVISGANDYASSDFDVRHSVSGALTFAIPSAFRVSPWSLLTRDWSLDAIVVARTGFPFNGVVLLASPDLGGYALSRPDRAPGEASWIQDRTAPGGKILNAAAFLVPPTPRQGNEPRNDIAGFGLTQVDLSLNRKFPLSDRFALQFRADAFNLFNHPNFSNPQAFVEFGPFYLRSQRMLNQGLGGLNPIFQQGGPRSLQVSLKLSF